MTATDCLFLVRHLELTLPSKVPSHLARSQWWLTHQRTCTLTYASRSNGAGQCKKSISLPILHRLKQSEFSSPAVRTNILSSNIQSTIDTWTGKLDIFDMQYVRSHEGIRGLKSRLVLKRLMFSAGSVSVHGGFVFFCAVGYSTCGIGARLLHVMPSALRADARIAMWGITTGRFRVRRHVSKSVWTL
jgi:hypothetical protein